MREFIIFDTHTFRPSQDFTRICWEFYSFGSRAKYPKARPPASSFSIPMIPAPPITFM